MTALCVKRLVTATLALGLMSVAAGAQSVHVSHDKSVDFSAFKTYAMGTVTVGGDADSQMVQFMVSAVDSRMSALGFRKVETDPDVLVETQVWRGLSYPFWYSHQFTELDLNTRELIVGKVVVDVIDARTGNLVFRGTAKDALSLKTRTNERKAGEAVAEIFDESPWGTDFDD